MMMKKVLLLMMASIVWLQSMIYAQRASNDLGPVPNRSYRTIGETDTARERGSVFNPSLALLRSGFDDDRDTDDQVEEIVDDLLEENDDDERDDEVNLGEKLRESAIEATKTEVCRQLQAYDEEGGMPYAGFDYGEIDFRDIRNSRYRGAVIELSQYCLVHGYFNSGFYFGVKEHITVGEAYKILVRAVMNDDFVMYGVIVDTAHWAQPYALATREEWKDIQSHYDSLDDEIYLRDYMKLVVMIMDKYMPREYKVEFDVVSDTRKMTRGEAAAMTQVMLERLYQYEESPLAEFEYDGDSERNDNLPAYDDRDTDDDQVEDIVDDLLDEDDSDDRDDDELEGDLKDIIDALLEE